MLSPLLCPLSGLWYLGATAKNWLYDHRWLAIESLPVPVVSVGAITAGGTHKTPLVHLLAKILQPFGQIAILSRGYKTQDEPKLFRRRLPKALVLVGKDRILSGKKAMQQGAKLLLLDDGFQYRRLHRDIELLTIASENPYGFNTFLPRGLLRDPPSRLREADAIFMNGIASTELRQLPIPLISMHLVVRRVLDLQGNPAPPLTGQKVGAFCGIARPSRFFKTLEDLGVECVGSWILPDHAIANQKKLGAFAEQCRRNGATALLCTEKDAVKYFFDSSFPLPFFYVEVELEIHSGHERWKNLIEKIVLKMNNYSLYGIKDDKRANKNYAP
jgi:tetraacyldisaccharide 4'-kinase